MEYNDVFKTLRTEYRDLQSREKRKPMDELILTVLSQHTSDINAEKAFLKLKKVFPTWEIAFKADISDITEAINGAGLHNVKSVRIKAILNRISELVGRLDISFLKNKSLSEAKEWLMSLPGVGPKTAAVVLCFSLDMPAMPVDTHVYRVSRRLGLITEETSVDEAHDILENMARPKDVLPFHLSLIMHGRTICRARNPKCNECVLGSQCPSYTVLAD